MKNLLWIILVVCVFIASWLVGRLLQQKQPQTFQPLQIPSCNPVAAPCVVKMQDVELVVKLFPPVIVMSPFKIQVASDADVSAVHLSFRMKNMEMGMQRYALIKNADGQWQTDVVLPVCSLGRSDWTLILETEYVQQLWRGELEFTAGHL